MRKYSKESTLGTDDLYDLYDLFPLHDLDLSQRQIGPDLYFEVYAAAHVAAWEPL